MKMLDRLLAQLKNRGISVEYVGEDALTLKGNTAQATPELLATVKAFKPELLERLRPRDMTLPRSEVHHPTPKADEDDGLIHCGECASHVKPENGREDIALLCDRVRCPYKRKR
jgi:hypothetical protein